MLQTPQKYNFSLIIDICKTMLNKMLLITVKQIRLSFKKKSWEKMNKNLAKWLGVDV